MCLTRFRQLLHLRKFRPKPRDLFLQFRHIGIPSIRIALKEVVLDHCGQRSMIQWLLQQFLWPQKECARRSLGELSRGNRRRKRFQKNEFLKRILAVREFSNGRRGLARLGHTTDCFQHITQVQQQFSSVETVIHSHLLVVGVSRNSSRTASSRLACQQAALPPCPIPAKAMNTNSLAPGNRNGECSAQDPRTQVCLPFMSSPSLVTRAA